MEALEALTTRTTTSQALMAGPGPNDEQIAAILAAGAAAPDHGKLRPWHFIVIRGDARHRLGDIFAAALTRRAPKSHQAEIKKQRNAPLRAPLIIVVVARIDGEHTKIPKIEQIASAAAAAQNMLIAAHAQGYACKWSTGVNAYDEHVRDAVGTSADDLISGYLYIGSHAGTVTPATRVPPDNLVTHW